MDAPEGEQQDPARGRRIVDRVADLQRDQAAATPPADAPPTASARPAAPAADLGERVAHLERELEALQDQVYRQAQRHEAELTELRQELRPENIARSLSEDERRRGL